MPTDTTQPTASQAAHHRRSIRAFTPEPLSIPELDTLLGEAGRAPSAFNLQPWRFVVVSDPEVKKQLAAAAYDQPQVTAAPSVIVLYTDMANTLATLDELVRPGTPPEKAAKFAKKIHGIYDPQTEEQRETWAQAAGNIALGYLLLLAETRGYATSPMGGFEPEKVKALLGLPAGARIPALVAIGHGAEPGQASLRHPVRRIVRHV